MVRHQDVGMNRTTMAMAVNARCQALYCTHQDTRKNPRRRAVDDLFSAANKLAAANSHAITLEAKIR